MPAVRQAARNQVLQNLVLRVDDNPLAVGQLLNVEVKPLAIPLQSDAVVEMTFAHHALAQSQFVQQRHHPVFQNAGADCRLHLRAVAGFQVDRVDPGTVKEVGQEQPRRARADNSHLSAHRVSP